MGSPNQGLVGNLIPSSQYYVVYPAPNGQLVYTLTGIVQMDIQGKATGLDYFRTSVSVEVPIPLLPAGKGLRLIHWAPFFALNSISNDGVAENAAWAVDDFQVTSSGRVSTSVTVELALAVRDIDGYILRSGYFIQLLGTLADLPGPPR